MQLTIETDTDRLERKRIGAMLNVYALGTLDSGYPQDRLTQPQRTRGSLIHYTKNKRRDPQKKKRARKATQKSRRRNR